MELRLELQPSKVNKKLLNRLAKLADSIDGSSEEESKESIAEFNRLSQSSLDYSDFQGIYNAMSHIDWVRLLLSTRMNKRVADVTRDELIEIVNRISEDDAYLEIFEINTSTPFGSNLIYWPDHVPGFDFGEKQEPSAEEIVDFVLQYKKTVLPKDEIVELLDKHMNSLLDTELTIEEFYLLSENLEGFEINYLSIELKKRKITAQEAIELIQEGKIIAKNKKATFI